VGGCILNVTLRAKLGLLNISTSKNKMAAIQKWNNIFLWLFNVVIYSYENQDFGNNIEENNNSN
jgi:hypothetical protein